MMGCVAASIAGFGSTDFTFTGTYTWIQDNASNWRLKFLSSGVFTPKKSLLIDAFLVGGGGGGGGRGGGGVMSYSGVSGKMISILDPHAGQSTN